MPPTSTVMSTKGKMVMEFPANPCLAVQNDPHLLSSLANVFEFFDANQIDDAMPHTSKGGAMHVENRDTASPRYINEAIHGILRALSPSEGLPEETTFIRKRLDDHILWDSAYLPWRRSAIWLLIRVALQSTLAEKKVSSGPFGYKSFQTYFLSSIIQQALDKGNGTSFPPSDLLHFMNTKLAKKIWKIKNIIDDPKNPFSNIIDACISNASQELERRWSCIRRQFSVRPPLQEFSIEEIKAAQHLSMENSRNHLLKIHKRMERPYFKGVKQKIFLDTEKSLVSPLFYNKQSLPTEICIKEPHMGLYRFENWVENHLHSWGEAASFQSCPSLLSIFRKYQSVAESRYHGNPERLSVMYLVMFELWVVMDRIARRWCPMIAEYSCDIELSTFEPLILPPYRHLSRLHDVECYIQSRNATTSIFSSQVSQNSFSVRYFDSSQKMRDLKVAIDEWSQKEQTKLKIQYNEKKKTQYNLFQTASKMECSKNPTGHTSKKCSKCRMQKKARALRIEVFEEPLPKNSYRMKQIVFELDPPETFIVWRDMTFEILLISLFEEKPGSSTVLYPLHRYRPLDSFYRGRPNTRITLASTHKSVSATHYKRGKIPDTFSSLIVPHAGDFKFFDASKTALLPSKWEFETLRRRCSYKLPTTLSSLQSFLDHTEQPPNDAIAGFSNIPKTLEYEGYIAFSLLRCGNRIQFRTLGRLLMDRSLPLSDDSTYILILQMLWQVEKRSEDSIVREAHIDIADESFAHQILDVVSNKLSEFKETSKDCISLAILVNIVIKIFSFGQREVKERVLEFLNNIRDVTWTWLQVAKQERDKSEPSHLEQRQRYMIHVAMVFRSTFDIDNEYISRLFQKSDNLSRFLHARIIAGSTRMEGNPSHLIHLLERDQTLSFRTQKLLTEALLGNNRILDQVIMSFWSGYQAGGKWVISTPPLDRWLHVKTPRVMNNPASSVHLNLLNGDLRVNSRTVGHLPQEYVTQKTFKVLFGSSVSIYIYTLLYIPF